jgi:hypothetical protein
MAAHMHGSDVHGHKTFESSAGTLKGGPHSFLISISVLISCANIFFLYKVV